MATGKRSPVLRLLRWTLWLGLLAALVLQLRVLAHGGLRLPAFAAPLIERAFAAQGLAFHADAIWLDPRGRVLLLEPRLALATPGETAPPPFASARAVTLQLRRRHILAGRAEILRADIAGLDLSLPPALSPSGSAQPLLTGGEFILHRPSPAAAWQVAQASARVLSIPTAFAGVLPAPAPASDAPALPAHTYVRLGLRHAAHALRHIAALPLDSVRHIRIDLAPDHVTASAEIPALLVPAHPALPPALVGSRLDHARLSARLVFGSPQADSLHISAARLSAPPALALESGPLALLLRRSPDALLLDLAADRIQKTDTPVPATPVLAALRYEPASRRLRGELSVRLADAPWTLDLDADTLARSGRATAQGELTPALLPVVAAYLPEKTRAILSLTDPVRLALDADFAPGAHPVSVTARASGGRAVAGHVVFAGAESVLRYEPAAHRFAADPLRLVLPDGDAIGSYEMDTQTLAFRFLLGGRLRPMDIEGWFTGWWDSIWQDFHFGPRPPEAEVDIRGTWGAPELTTVFVGAQSGPMALRELALDAVSTRVMVRHNHLDVLRFHVAQKQHTASGRFSRTLAEDHTGWQKITFDLRSDLPLSALPDLFREDGAQIAAPFALSAPPAIRLAGHALGPGSGPAAGRQHYTLDLAADAPLRYAGFPLEKLSVRVERHDAEIRLEDLRAGLASGLATGRAVLSGPPSARWLAFDIALQNASLDSAASAWRTFQTTRNPDARPATPDKPLGGTLDLRLSANGPADQPLRFSGTGSARITAADLARIRLLGRFSQLLSGLGIGLTTLQLSDADAPFTLEQNRLRFPDLKLTGPSALIEARGDYLLDQATLDFTARVRPFERREGILGSTVDFVLNPVSAALEVELTGNLDDPEWTFSYGPTQLFRRITGSRSKPAQAPEEPDSPR